MGERLLEGCVVAVDIIVEVHYAVFRNNSVRGEAVPLLKAPDGIHQCSVIDTSAGTQAGIGGKVAHAIKRVRQSRHTRIGFSRLDWLLDLRNCFSITIKRQSCWLRKTWRRARGNRRNPATLTRIILPPGQESAAGLRQPR